MNAIYQNTGISRKRRRPAPNSAQLQATVWRWSKVLGHKYDTLWRWLVVAGVRWEPYSKLPAIDILRAVEGPDYDVKLRVANVLAGLRELKLKKLELNLSPTADTERAVLNAMRSIRQRVLCLSSEAAHLCNPADPEQARQALAAWLEGFLPLVAEERSRSFERLP
jgi:hypothetical protein